MIEHIWCYLYDSENIVCNGTKFVKYEAPLNFYDEYFWIYLAIYILLTLGAGLMSGLTLGLLSLDALSLEVLMRAGVEPEAKYARRLYPLIKRHHLLLVTLLLGNAACVESMPIFLDRISNPLTAIIVSVTAVLIFGEVIPQALCKRYGLAIGYYMIPLVYLLVGLSIVVGYPISLILDYIFGDEYGNYYRRPQLKALIDLHGPSAVVVNSCDKISEEGLKRHNGSNSPKNEEVDNKDRNYQLSIEEVNIIKGALDLTTMTAKDALVPLEHVFMLSDAAILDKHAFKQISLVAHSRIPVYYGTERRLIRGILLTKMLIEYNSSETLPLETLMKNNKCFQPLRYVTETTPLYDLLKLFKTGKTGHMAVVVKDNIEEEELDALERYYSIRADDKSWNLVSVFPPVEGIITLEDVLEKLIQSEIKDEGDIFRHDICRRLIYKQKERRAQSQIIKGTIGTNSKGEKFLDSDMINEYVSLTMGPETTNFDDRSSLIPKNKQNQYRTFDKF